MKYTDIPYFFVFDVESVGLHGEAFAVGYTVPEHNPLADARQSARLLTMALRGECLTFNP